MLVCEMKSGLIQDVLIHHCYTAKQGPDYTQVALIGASYTKIVKSCLPIFYLVGAAVNRAL
jgi:hypothetical protein